MCVHSVYTWTLSVNDKNTVCVKIFFCRAVDGNLCPLCREAEKGVVKVPSTGHPWALPRTVSTPAASLLCNLQGDKGTAVHSALCLVSYMLCIPIRAMATPAVVMNSGPAQLE